MKMRAAVYSAPIIIALACIVAGSSACAWKSAAKRAAQYPARNGASELSMQLPEETALPGGTVRGAVSGGLTGKGKISGAAETPAVPESSAANGAKIPGSGAAGGEARYSVYSGGEFLRSFAGLDAAVSFAGGGARREVYKNGSAACLWDNCPPFEVYAAGGSDKSLAEFGNFHEAVSYARQNGRSLIYFRKSSGLVWQNAEPLKGRASLAAPYISQLPELPRGCEVTSLAMLLNYYGAGADKMELARRVKKNGAEYESADGAVRYGDPNDGFVGDIYSSGGPGLGVYHGPIYELLAEYMPRRAMDLTGCGFDDLFGLLENGAPVWVIVNSTFAPLPASAFQTWMTPNGPVDVTYYEHSVLVTGYDGEHVYFNDPLGLADRAPREAFAAAWEQMGRQAVAAAPKGA